MMATILNSKKSVAFDLDGTLISISKRDYLVYFDIVNGMNKIPLDFDSYWKLRLEKTNINQLLSVDGPVDEIFINEFLRLRNEKIESLEYLFLDTLFDRALNVLENYSKIYNCFLVTSRCNKLTAEQQVEHLKIRKYFKKIIISEKNKLNSYSRIPSLSLIVGDTENDILPAKELKIKSFAISTGIRSHSFLKEYNPTYLSTNIEDLLTINV